MIATTSGLNDLLLLNSCLEAHCYYIIYPPETTCRESVTFRMLVLEC